MGASNPDHRTGRTADLLAPLLSAAIFGYYGFLAGLETSDANGVVPLWLGSVWILRIAAILFASCIGLALLDNAWSEAAYGGAGLLAAAGLLAILVWDQLDTANATAFHPLLLLVFAIWNGFASVSTLRAALR